MEYIQNLVYLKHHARHCVGKKVIRKLGLFPGGTDLWTLKYNIFRKFK